jgi:hypothetical protein
MQRGERVRRTRSNMPPSHLNQAAEFLVRNGQLVCKGSGQGSQWTFDASRAGRREESVVILIPIQESSTPSSTQQEDPLILPRSAIPIPSRTRFLNRSNLIFCFTIAPVNRPISNSISHPSSITTTTVSLYSLEFLHHHYQSGSGSP